MKTICVLNGKVVMMQSGDALVAMKSNAAQYPGAVANVVTDEEYAAMTAPTLTENKVIMWRKIHDERVRRYFASGYHVSGNWFHSDAISRSQQQGLWAKAKDRLASGGVPTDVLQANGADIQWKTMSGLFVPMTVQLALDVFQAAGDSDAALFAAAQKHKAAMESSSNPLIYDYSTGWPTSFA